LLRRAIQNKTANSYVKEITPMLLVIEVEGPAPIPASDPTVYSRKFVAGRTVPALLTGRSRIWFAGRYLRTPSTIAANYRAKSAAL
jgi:hypothetical protein